MGDGWIAAVVLGGLCVLSALWTLATAPGFNVRDKHVFLSGGTKGLGLAIAKKYACAGAKLSLVGRSLERLERAKEEIQQAADNVSIFLAECDISDHEQVERAIAAANEFHGHATDHVVHAAMVVKPGYAWDQDFSQLRHDMGATYFGAVNMFKKALPAMIVSKVRGRFVIVSCAGGLTSSIGSSSYSGALFALQGLADSLRNEMILYGISVSIFLPGKIDRSLDQYKYLPNLAIEASSTYVPHLHFVHTPIDVFMSQSFTRSFSLRITSPIDNHDRIVSDYATFPDQSATFIANYDASAANFVDGLRAGYFTITNSWSGYFTRVLANGVAPRKNNGIEILLIFFVAGYKALETVILERGLSLNEKKTPASPSTAAASAI